MGVIQRLNDVLRMADLWQRRAGDGDLLALMRAASESNPWPPRWLRDEGWRSAILRSQVDPVYRAIIAARVHQKAPSEATHTLVLLWFATLWPVDPTAPEARGGWARGVPYPLTAWRDIPRPNPKKKEAA